MKNIEIAIDRKRLWQFTIDLAIELCELLDKNGSYQNIRLLYKNGQMMIHNNFKNQKELLYPFTNDLRLRSLWINANNPEDLENPLQIQLVLHFQPQLENTVCVIWKTDEQFNISLQDSADMPQLAQDIFAKVKSKSVI